MSEVTSVNGKTGAVVLKAAEVEAVATSEVAQPSGVASLNVSGKLPEAQLPSSVVSGSATGGAPAWKASTKYAVNQLAQSSEVTYICLEAHESGASFPGAGTKWAPVAGAAVEVSAPAPTGVAATDTANIQAALTAAAGGVCKIAKPGTYAINATLVRPYNASIFLAPGCTLQASAAIAGPLLSDSKTERSLRQCIIGGGVLDSNNNAQNALWCRYFQRGMTLGVVCKNSTQHDCILGDVAATAASDEAFFTEQFACDRTAGTVPVGYYSLWIQRCSDGRFPESLTATGQETGVRIDTGGWRGFGAHPFGAAYPMQVCVDDNSGGTELFGSNYDTPTPKEHAGATGSAVSGTITDAEILSQHENRPVTGTNIPAESFVGTVTAATSFVLVNTKGVEVKPTGEVKGVTLLGVGRIIRGAGPKDIGGEVFISPTYGVDNGAVGIVLGHAVNNPYSCITDFTAKGGEATFRVTQAIVGNISATSWSGLIQVNCVKLVTPTDLVAGNLLEMKSPSTPGLLARVQYAPSSQSAKTTESTSLVAVDETNLKVSFVAPPSGDVMVRLEAFVTNATNGDKVHWALLEGSTQKGPAGCVSPSNTAGIRPLTILVTGLTSGESYTWDWAWAVSAGKGEMVAMATASPWTNGAAPATMEVWAA